MATASVSTWVRGVTWPNDLDGAEPWHVHAMQHAWPGEEHVVSDVTKPPHNTLPYTPGYYIYYSIAGRMTGADDFEGFQFAARSLTFGASLIAIVLVMVCSNSLGVRTWIAVACGLTLITAGAVQAFSVNPRPDALANCLNIAGAVLAVRYRSVIGTAIVLGLAVSCKHSHLALPAVLLGSFLFEREWRNAIIFSITGIGTIALIFLAGYFAMGPHYLDGFPLQSFAGAMPKQALYFLGRAAPWCAVPFVFGMVYPLVAWPDWDRRAMTMYAAFVLALFLHTVAMMKPGAFIDYLLEPATLGAVLAACTIERLMRVLASPIHRSAVVVVGLAIVLPFSIQLADRVLDKWREQPADLSALTVELKTFEGPIFSDSGTIYRIANKPFWNYPDLASTALTSGAIDSEPVRRMFESHEFDAVVVTTNWIEDGLGVPEVWKKQILESYELAEEVDRYWIYLPKQ